MKRLNGTKQINLINLAKWLDNYRGMDVIIIQKLLSTINLISSIKSQNGKWIFYIQFVCHKSREQDLS